MTTAHRSIKILNTSKNQLTKSKFYTVQLENYDTFTNFSYSISAKSIILLQDQNRNA